MSPPAGDAMDAQALSPASPLLFHPRFFVSPYFNLSEVA